jgi:hypothetical protein
MLSKLQSLVDKKLSKGEHALDEELKIAEDAKRKSKAHFFVLQALEALKTLELEGGKFICSSPDFECYFKKKYMPLFEEKNAYVKVAFDKADNVTHVCGLLPRLQHEKKSNKTKDENLTLSKMPNCLLSHAIAELSLAPQNNLSKAGNAVYQGQTASMQQQGSNFILAPYSSGRSLQGPEKEWLDSMQASLIDNEYGILLHLLQHSIIAHGFQEAIEYFLSTKQELEPGSCSVVIDSFKYLAREFPLDEQIISVAQIGSSLKKRLDLKPNEIFSVIVELFFCLGYDKEIKGYTTGFIAKVSSNHSN